MGHKKYTIKDIAERAGLGVGTVSRVLNNNPNVKDSTRDRVLKITRELNYIPNGSARMLVTRNRSHKTVGLLISAIENQFFYELFKAIHDRLKLDDYKAMIFDTEDEFETAVNQIVEQQMAGMMVFGDCPLSDRSSLLLKSHRIPFLYVDYYGGDINFVRFNNYRGGQLAADYLIDKGCRKVILFGESLASLQQKDRFRGFADRVIERKIPLRHSEVSRANYCDTYDLSRTLMGDPELDGIFYFCDEMAYGGIQARNDTGASVAIVGYDDIFPSKFLNLTTINQSSKKLGSEAGSAILNLIENRDRETPPLQRLFEPTLMNRGS
ncbi:MAG: LacI family DNA-binding transcriptional regulator [Spirochaetales bacterium]|nr:LacI family DNA-binding transcriptional regulator [Spirochaetales bacterium]